jgi:uncharacterized damage-inducible protein DinB
VAEDKDGLLKHYQEMREQLLTAIDGLSDELIAEPSLDGWSVKDHLAHLAAWDEIRAAEVLRISAGHASAWRMTDEQGGLYNALAYDLRRALPPAQVKWELETSQQNLLDAISSATARGLDPSLYGEAGLRSTHEAEHTGWIARWRRKKTASRERTLTPAAP